MLFWLNSYRAKSWGPDPDCIQKLHSIEVSRSFNWVRTQLGLLNLAHTGHLRFHYQILPPEKPAPVRTRVESGMLSWWGGKICSIIAEIQQWAHCRYRTSISSPETCCWWTYDRSWFSSTFSKSNWHWTCSSFHLTLSSSQQILWEFSLLYLMLQDHIAN